MIIIKPYIGQTDLEGLVGCAYIMLTSIGDCCGFTMHVPFRLEMGTPNFSF